MKKWFGALLVLLTLLCIQTPISLANNIESKSFQQEENTPHVADYEIRMDVDRLSYMNEDELLSFSIVLTNTGDTNLELVKVKHSLFPQLQFEQTILAPKEEISTTATYTVLEGDILQGSIAGNLNVQMKNCDTDQIIVKQSNIVLRKPVVLPEFDTRESLPRSGTGSNLVLLLISLSFVGLAAYLLIRRPERR